MRSEKRVLGLVICAVLVLSVLFSSVYIVCAANHACCGQCCLICISIARAEQILRGLVVLMALAAALAVTALFYCVGRADAMRRLFSRVTPVQWKIRLND